MKRRSLSWSRRLKSERQRRGWSLEEVARKLETNSKVVERWERGVGFPRPVYQAQLCEIYQKTPGDLGFPEGDLDEVGPASMPPYIVGEATTDKPAIPSHIDWGEAPQVEQLYGRDEELLQVERWMEKGSRIIAILGAGGIGKTFLAVRAIERVQHAFDYVIWRSMQNARPLQSILQDCLLFFSDQRLGDLPVDLEAQVSLLLANLRRHRCLLVLDNIETIFQSGDETGLWRQEYEGFGYLIKRIGEMPHQSCLLLTSREKPKEISFAEGSSSAVHTLHLTGLELEEGKAILQKSGLFGPDEAWKEFIHLYSGNPLSLRIISGTIRDIFGGNISRFLKAGMAVFGDVYDLLSQQFHRLSLTEQEIMFWLAVEREAVSPEELRDDMLHASQNALFKALESLQRRYMTEKTTAAQFTLQPVVMEYVTGIFIEEIQREIETEEPRLLNRHALMKARTRDYVRETQIRLVLTPLIQRLLDTMEKEDIEMHCQRILAALRTTSPRKPGYAAGNLLNLLIQMKADLQGYDFSYLHVCHAYLQGTLLPDVNFTRAHIERSIFTDTFGNILAVAFSADGSLLATGTSSCEIRIWQLPDSAPLFSGKGHAHWVWSVAFSPDGRLLASGSEDRTVRLWDVHTRHCKVVLRGHKSWSFSVKFSPDGTLLADGGEDHCIWLWDVQNASCRHILQGHNGGVRTVAFHPSGALLASGSEDHTVRIWDIVSGTCLKVLEAHTNLVGSVAFSPDGRLLASGGGDQTIRLWDVQTWNNVGVLQGHTNRINAVKFSPDGRLLASGSDDQTIRLWDIQTGYCLNSLQGCANGVTSVAFHPDGTMLASGSNDRTVRLWSVATGRCLNSLTGYTHGIVSVAFSPDQSILASGSEDQTIRLWDIEKGQHLSTLQGHTSWVWSVAFSPDGTILASGSEDQTIRLWEVSAKQCINTLQGHTSRVSSVAFSPDGTLLISGSNDHTMRLWAVSTGECLSIFTGHTSRVEDAVFSPDGSLLASGSEDQTARLWSAATGRCLHILQGHTSRVRAVAFSPNGRLLASGSYDQHIRLWEVESGRCLATWEGHTDFIRSVTFSPDGRLLASGGYDRIVRLWEVSTGRCIQLFSGHTDWIRSVAFSPDGKLLASGSRDGTIRYWEVRTGFCRNVLSSDRPYERMNITNMTGLTETEREVLRTLGAIADKDHG